jgi:hypothetical protein
MKSGNYISIPNVKEEIEASVKEKTEQKIVKLIII